MRELDFSFPFPGPVLAGSGSVHRLGDEVHRMGARRLGVGERQKLSQSGSKVKVVEELSHWDVEATEVLIDGVDMFGGTTWFGACVGKKGLDNLVTENRECGDGAVGAQSTQPHR